MDVSLETKKYEIFEQAKTVGLSQEEIEKVYAEAVATAKGRGDKDPEPRALSILQTSLKKKISLGADYYLVVLGSNTTDYGVSYHYTGTLARWEEADDETRRQMVANKEVNEKGQPLYMKGFAKGKVIENPEGNFEQQVFFYGRKADEQQFKHGVLHVRDFKNISFPLFRKLKVRAEARRNQPEGYYDLNVTGAGAVEVLDQNEINMADFSRKYLADRIVQLSDLESYHSRHDGSADRLAIVECNVIRLDEGRQDAPSDILVVDDLSLGMGNGIMGITCWLPKSIPKDFHTESKGIFVFANTGISKRDGAIVLNVCGVWTPDTEKVRVHPKPLSQSQIQERVVDLRSASPKPVEPQPRTPTAEQPF